jgi:2-keto-3-deoxy-L-rhamnonate aldolase RhmA
MLDLVLFENEPEAARQYLQAGITSFLVDLELLGKDQRQLGFDTEIRPGTLRDLQRIAALPGTTAWCRINRFGAHTPEEVERALDAGADILILPMAESLAEIDAYLRLLDRRCRAGIMIETQACAALAGELGQLPLDYAFFGLNDFAISRGGGLIFNALADGSVEAVSKALPGIHFGVGGLTDINRGSPIRSARLLEEMERLGCRFTFLRRSFRRDSRLVHPAEIVAGIRDYWQRCAARSDAERDADHRELVSAIDRCRRENS